MNTNSNNLDQDRNETLMRAVRAELERDAAALDELTVARLRAARLQALDSVPRTGGYTPLWLSAGAVALVVLATSVTLRMQAQVADEAAQESLEMMTMMDDDYALYENLELYEWLETETDENLV